jgi:hypothetical protein
MSEHPVMHFPCASRSNWLSGKNINIPTPGMRDPGSWGRQQFATR